MASDEHVFSSFAKVGLVFLLAVSSSTTLASSWNECHCPSLNEDGGGSMTSIGNASICVSVPGSHPRCEITVQCLEDGETGPGCSENPLTISDATELLQPLQTLTRIHLRLRGDSGAITIVANNSSSTDTDQPLDENVLKDLMERYGGEINSCLSAYRAASVDELEEPFSTREDGVYACIALPDGLLQLTLVDPALGLKTKDGLTAITFQFAVPNGQ